VLVLVAESTAWATQLRLLTRTLQAKLREQVGPEVVTSIVVRGPAQPDWRKGPRRVQGPGARGPRDTYG
jgi:predicted nucleic acid-binding Zn ribbon protein